MSIKFNPFTGNLDLVGESSTSRFSFLTRICFGRLQDLDQECFNGLDSGVLPITEVCQEIDLGELS